MEIKLYSASMIGKELNVSKDYIHKLHALGKIPGPLYSIGTIKGWTKEQLEDIRKELNK